MITLRFYSLVATLVMFGCLVFVSSSFASDPGDILPRLAKVDSNGKALKGASVTGFSCTRWDNDIDWQCQNLADYGSIDPTLNPNFLNNDIPARGQDNTHRFIMWEDKAPSGYNLDSKTYVVERSCGIWRIAPVTTRNPADLPVDNLTDCNSPVLPNSTMTWVNSKTDNTGNLVFYHAVETVVIQPGQTVKPRVTCKDGYKGVTATFNLPTGVVQNGNDPQPKTREFTLTNTTPSVQIATVDLVCVKERLRNSDDQITVLKVEQHVDLDAGQTVSAVASCPTGYFATDGSVRVDHVDQGTGTLEDIKPLQIWKSSARNYSFTVKNEASGRAQAKVIVTCMSAKTAQGKTIKVTSTKTLTLNGVAGMPLTGIVTCPTGTMPTAPSVQAGSPLVLNASELYGNRQWKMTVTPEANGPISFKADCIKRATV